jgi:hypothetical protein
MKFSWDKTKTIKVLKGAGLAAAGAAAAAAASYLSTIDFGIYGPLVGAAVSIALNALRQAIRENEVPAEQEEVEEN